jgi:hypothetical protein
LSDAVQVLEDGKSIAAVVEARQQSSPMRRFGDPDEFGSACAFLCGTSAAYITAQNLLIDGGKYPADLRGARRVRGHRELRIVRNAVRCAHRWITLQCRMRAALNADTPVRPCCAPQ